MSASEMTPEEAATIVDAHNVLGMYDEETVAKAQAVLDAEYGLETE